MGIKLNDCEPRLRERLQRQMLAEDSRKGLRPGAAQPAERMPLEDGGEPEDPHWYATLSQFEIRFTVYSVRPADYDGYDIKALQDFCVKVGIIPEDRWDVITSGTVCSRKAATEGEERTEIEITAAKK